MAQNISLMGADYTAVPAVVLPKTGGGTAQFDDTTDADATAADIMSGKTAYVNGVKLTGTASGSAVKTQTGTFTGNGTRQVTVTCPFEPDLVYWYGDPGTAASSGTVSCMIGRDMMAANRYRNNSTSNSNSIVAPISGMNAGGTTYNFQVLYSDGTVTLYCRNSAARSLFTSGRTYSYEFIKWTT